jgi:hypothetical protein
MVGVLAQALWMLADGARCVVTGRFAGTFLKPSVAIDADGYVVQLGDGRFIEYGPWAFLPDLVGLHPHAFAPLFIGLGLAGVVALVLYLMRRPIGWFATLAFCVASLWYLVIGTALSALVLVVLLLPATRARFLGPTPTPTPPAPAEDPA